jgi:hypothetical protein
VSVANTTTVSRNAGSFRPKALVWNRWRVLNRGVSMVSIVSVVSIVSIRDDAKRAATKWYPGQELE